MGGFILSCSSMKRCHVIGVKSKAHYIQRLEGTFFVLFQTRAARHLAPISEES